MKYIGVDGCRSGWFAVIRDENRGFRTALYRNVNELWEANKSATLILIDIPIGLLDNGLDERLCDKEARRLIGIRRSSIFPVPCREAVYTYDGTASEINRQYTGRKLSKQSFAIIPKIRQVDLLLSTDREARGRIKETHPELCFTGLNGGEPMKYSKKKENGFQERINLLSDYYAGCRTLVSKTLDQYNNKGIFRDDVVDALALAITASIAEKALSTIPADTKHDAAGLPMQMVYYLKKE